MTEENQALEAEQETTTQAAEEAASSIQEAENGKTEAAQGGEQEQARDFEAEAKEMGWVPKDQFRGDIEKWKPADEFVRRGEEILPIVKSQNKKLQEKLEKQETEFAKRLERMERMNTKATERQKEAHQAELDRLKADMRQAVEDGDTAAFDKLETQREKLSKQTFDEPAETEAKKPEDIVVEWAKNNTWYDTDFDMHVKAKEYSNFIARPDLSLEANLAQTEAYMRKEHPELFGGTTKKSAANGHAAVDSGGDFPGGGRKEGPAAKLPAEAKAQAEADVKAGLYKSVDDWAKVYFG